jgi:phosphatidylserine/phosphatidylglycerophosphate/cardiolipin synthase-like enzyme
VISSPLLQDINTLIRRAHRQWLESSCAVLDSANPARGVESLITSLPPTNNGDAAHCLIRIIRQTDGMLSWKALAASIQIGCNLATEWRSARQAELLWTGPAPSGQIAARRIDQILYDLIGHASREILLITFAAHKIERLAGGLATALDRGVHVRLILEFEEASQGQLSMDAIQAFPEIIRQRAKIFYWPIDKRERNSLGKPGKLHAKAAIIDDQVVLSSANLTDDAFNRNLELGVLLYDENLLQQLRAHFDGLCVDGTLKLWKS